jgi:hypothetical protein
LFGGEMRYHLVFMDAQKCTLDSITRRQEKYK